MRVSILVFAILTVATQAQAESLISASGNAVEGASLKVKDAETGAGFACDISFGGKLARAGSLEFSSFGNNPAVKDETTRVRFDVSKKAEYRAMRSMTNTLSSEKDSSRTLSQPAGLVEYSVVTTPTNSPVQQSHNLYTIDPTQRFDTWTLVSIANTSSNKSMITLMNSLCDKARAAFNTLHPEAKVNSLGRDAADAAK